MSLIHCPECGNEVSNEAVACPNCGRPLSSPTPVIQRKDVVTIPPREDGVPKWIIAPIVILGAVAVFLLILLMRNSDEDSKTQSNNINVAIQRKSSDARDTPGRTQNPPNQIEVPPNSTTVDPPSTAPVPQNIPPPSQTNVPTVPPDKGLVVIDAKLSTKNGTIQAVKNEKFYLLDKDLESILSDANLEPIDGQSLANSFGLAVLYPDRYSNFQRDSLNAIKKHIKYNTTTDNGGKASMKDVKPDSYYLFAITKTRTGFAIWSSPVSIMAGENKLNLSPAQLNEMSE